MNSPQPSLVIFTDVDGTLLDQDNSYNVAEPTVRRALARRIPIVLCSSKTRSEQETLRNKLCIPDPFIVENGSAIFFPRGYFNGQHFRRSSSNPELELIELGVTKEFIRDIWPSLKREFGTRLGLCFSDMTTSELTQVTGLRDGAAASARDREYSETIVGLDAGILSELTNALSNYDLSIVGGGRFHTIASINSSKGNAVREVGTHFRQKLGAIITVGLGDSDNDESLLEAVDEPRWVNGPVDWIEAVERLLERYP